MKINIIKIIAYALIALLPGLVFIILLMEYIDSVRCTEIVQGECLEIYKYSSTYSTYLVCYKIKFSYCYNRKKYKVWSLERFGKMPKNFIEDETYSLFINPHKPDIVRCKKETLSISKKINLVIMGWVSFVCISGVIIIFAEWIQIYFKIKEI